MRHSFRRKQCGKIAIVNDTGPVDRFAITKPCGIMRMTMIARTLSSSVRFLLRRDELFDGHTLFLFGLSSKYSLFLDIFIVYTHTIRCSS